MKIRIIVLLGAALFFTPMTFAQTSGEILFNSKCSSCHVTMRPADISTLSAPPVMGVMRHVKMTYKTREEAVQFITEYTLDPQKSKAVCMADKIKRFGLMPSQKGYVSKEELVLIAGWMYDNFGNQGQGNRNCKNGNCQGSAKACKGK